MTLPRSRSSTFPTGSSNSNASCRRSERLAGSIRTLFAQTGSASSAEPPNIDPRFVVNLLNLKIVRKKGLEPSRCCHRQPLKLGDRHHLMRQNTTERDTVIEFSVLKSPPIEGIRRGKQRKRSGHSVNGAGKVRGATSPLF